MESAAEWIENREYVHHNTHLILLLRKKCFNMLFFTQFLLHFVSKERNSTTCLGCGGCPRLGKGYSSHLIRIHSHTSGTITTPSRSRGGIHPPFYISFYSSLNIKRLGIGTQLQRRLSSFKGNQHCKKYG